MTDATVPAILGGDPIVDSAHEPTFPSSTELEIGLLAEITNSKQWFGFGDLPPYWRTILEQLVAETTGYRYGIGVANGTLGIANGLSSQLLAKMRTEPGWDRGRDHVLVADLTHASAHQGVLVGLLPQLQRQLTLVPVDAKPDATMNDDIVASYLAQRAERVLAIVPATMYGAFGNIGRLCDLAESHNVLIHHDNALGGAARYEGRLALTASISGQGQGKAVPAGEAGVSVTSDPEIAAILRADTDTGLPPGRLDNVPFVEMSRLASGNLRLGEHPAGLMAIQWLRAFHVRLQARENRRQIQELINDRSVFDVPLMWNAPMEEAYPPFFMFQLMATEALEEELGLTPQDVRAVWCAEGMFTEQGFTPTHLDPAWKHHAVGHDLSYTGSKHVYDRSLLVHTKFQRDPRFPEWIRRMLESIVEHKDRLRGIGDRVPVTAL